RRRRIRSGHGRLHPAPVPLGRPARTGPGGRRPRPGRAAAGTGDPRDGGPLRGHSGAAPPGRRPRRGAGRGPRRARALVDGAGSRPRGRGAQPFLGFALTLCSRYTCTVEGGVCELTYQALLFQLSLDTGVRPIELGPESTETGGHVYRRLVSSEAVA